MTGSREMYKVFTPFKNAFIKRLKEALPECVAAPSARGCVNDLPELTFDYPQQAYDHSLFPADEKRQSRSCASSVKRGGRLRGMPGFPH